MFHLIFNMHDSNVKTLLGTVVQLENEARGSLQEHITVIHVSRSFEYSQQFKCNLS